MGHYRKRPLEIEAVRWTGENWAEILAFLAGAGNVLCDPDSHSLLINTLEGQMRCSASDWLIRGIKGEMYACKPDVFTETYEAVEVGADVL